MTSLAERMNKLPKARRQKVEERAKALIAEEMSLQDLRKARKQTQVRVAQQLGITRRRSHLPQSLRAVRHWRST